MNQASAPWPSHIHGCCSILVAKERKVLQPSSLLLFCLLFFCFALSSVYHRPILEEGRIEKMEFPDVSSFPCPSPYRGCGGWPFGNRIHHLMRSFHSSIINITEGSIFRPPGKKIFEKLFQCSSGLRPAPFCGRSLRYVLPFPSHRHSVTGNDRIMMSLS